MQQKLINFPCPFPIKIFGLQDDAFEGIVIEILNKHVPDLGEGAISSRLSAGNKYLAITATIQATSQEQLDELYRALSSHPQILMVL